MTNTQVGPAVRPRPDARHPPSAMRPSVRDRGTRLLAALFLAPTVVGIVVFTVVPIVGSVVLSLFHWDVIDPPRFAGGANYRTTCHGLDRPRLLPQHAPSSWSSRSRCSC